MKNDVLLEICCELIEAVKKTENDIVMNLKARDELKAFIAPQICSENPNYNSVTNLKIRKMFTQHIIDELDDEIKAEAVEGQLFSFMLSKISNEYSFDKAEIQNMTDEQKIRLFDAFSKKYIDYLGRKIQKFENNQQSKE